MADGKQEDAVRRRIEALADADSFEACGSADGVVTGAAKVDGRLIHLAAQDFADQGGTAGKAHCLMIVEAMRRSLNTGSPFVFLTESGGARIQEGIDAMSGFGQVFRSNVLLSGAVPQISIVFGPCAGGAAISTALTDFVILTRKSRMFLYGPAVIKLASGVEISSEALGGADVHAVQSGVAHFVADDDQDAIDICRRLLSFLPSNHGETPPSLPGNGGTAPNAELDDIVPENSNDPYDVRNVIAGIVDDGDFLEIQAGHAANIVAGFGRIAGRSIGIVANQPLVLDGAIDMHAATKAARLVRLCDAFNIPIITFVDAPGFLPTVEQEQAGALRGAAQLMFAMSSATVPKIQVILRRSLGAGHVAMCSKDLGADCVFAWTTAEIALMDAESAVEIVCGSEIKNATDKYARRAELIDEYRATQCSPWVAMDRKLVGNVIEPANTRRHLAESLENIRNKKEVGPPKKHG